ncbi:MAG: HAD-IIB family hydrolase [Proteobacteria bacterium]|nr:HAD-IIB family hydrolase [Pseudomonadota bacterium]
MEVSRWQDGLNLNDSLSMCKETTGASEDAIPSHLFGILTDVDGTLTLQGQLRASTYEALWSLHHSGLKLIPVTGRSAAWGHMMLHHWPIDAVIAESGGLAMWRENATGDFLGADQVSLQSFRLARYCFSNPAHRERLIGLAEQWMAEHPPLRWASDQGQRQVDIAIDWNEQVKVPMDVVARFIEQCRKAGYSARASNIHINAWAGQFDKASSTLSLLKKLFGHDRQQAQANWFFVGDAPNDESMFANFPHHVAVQGPEHFEGHVEQMPKRYASAKASAGFEAWAQAIQRAIRSP